MLYGHIAAGLAAKTVAPKASLGVLLGAVSLLDILTGFFVFAGVERIGEGGYIAWSHGFFMSVVWSVATFVVAYLVSRNFRTGLVVGLAVFSHWALDFVSHPMGMGKILPPDLPLFFEGSPKLGLGLYNYLVPAVITEFGLYAAGIVIYLSRTRAKDRTGTVSFWLMFAFLALFALTALLPPNLSIVPCFVILLLLPFGIWIDKHREPVASAMPAVHRT